MMFFILFFYYTSEIRKQERKQPERNKSLINVLLRVETPTASENKNKELRAYGQESQIGKGI